MYLRQNSYSSSGLGAFSGLVRMRFSVPFLVGMALSTLAHAQPEETSAIVSTLPTAASVGVSVTQVHSASTTLRGDRKVEELSFSFGQESFLNRDPSPAGVSEYTQISARFRARTQSRPLSGVLDLGGSFATDIERYTVLEVPEAYLNWSNDPEAPAMDQSQVVIGRKRELWSTLDSEWGIGLVQPMNRFDALRASEQGLTGVFLQVARNGFGVIAYGSSVFIPDQGAPFDLEDGRFTTRSPWFTPPPDSLILFDQVTPVKYRLQVPSVGSVISHPSGGLIVRYGESVGTGLLAQIAYTKKPRNTLALPFEGKLSLTDNSTFGSVSVRPQVTYHNVTSADVAYRTRGFSIGMSALADVSDPEEIPDGFTGQKFAPLYLLSPHVESRLLPAKYWGPRVRLSYLHSIGGEITSVGTLQSNGNVFGPRTNYSRATSLTVNTLLVRRVKWNLEQGVRWIEELAENGTVVMTDLRLNLGEEWKITLSGDILGSNAPTDKTNTFIARYRGNDRVAGRVTYLF